MTDCLPSSDPQANIMEDHDQFADGIAARVWEIFIGDKDSRAGNYKDFLVNLLSSKGCKTVLDVACGTGIDSVMLLEEGFQVTSTDASDKMLKYALKTRWERRKESAFDNWVIEEANWVSLTDDVPGIMKEGFDALICLGNSFSMLQDPTHDGQNQRIALRHFEKCLKPGGLLIIDHRNFDDILKKGKAPPSKNIYYNSKHKADIMQTALEEVEDPSVVSLDYMIHGPPPATDRKSMRIAMKENVSKFRLRYVPHKLSAFTEMLKEVFGPGSKHTVYGDFKLLNQISIPDFYIHVMEKAMEPSTERSAK